MRPVHHANNARNPGPQVVPKQPFNSLRLLIGAEPDTLDRHADCLTSLDCGEGNPVSSAVTASTWHGPRQAGELVRKPGPLEYVARPRTLEYARLR